MKQTSKLTGMGVAVVLMSYIFSFESNNSKFEKIPKQNRIDLAAQQELLFTMNPQSGSIPKEVLLKSIQNSSQKRNISLPLAWKEIGPSNVAGRIRTILHAPNDSFPNQVYVGSASGGLWKTNNIRNEHVTWQELSKDLASLSVCALFDDEDQLLVGTGEGFFNHNSFPGVGLLTHDKTSEINSAIEQTLNGDFRYIQSISKADNGSILISTKDAGIQLSKDNGQSWNQVLGAGNVAQTNKANALIKLSDGKLIASMGIHESDGIYRSIDNGETWSEIMVGLPTDQLGRIELAASPGNRRVVYALISDVENGSTLGLYKSINQGSSWYKMSLPNAYGMNDFTANQSWYNLTIAVSPANPNRIVIGGIDLFVSTNGGLSFKQISHHTTDHKLPYVHADQHEIVFINDNDVLVGNDGGISLIENVFSNDRLVTNKNNGLNITQFYACDIRDESDEFIAGAQDNGTQKFESNEFVTTEMISQGDGARCYFDDNEPNVIISSYILNNYFVSVDSGKSFQYHPINYNGLFANPTDYDSDENILYAADAPGYFLRWNHPATDNIQEIVDLENVEAQISAVVIHPNYNDQVFFGTVEGKLYKTTYADTGSSVNAELIFEGLGVISDIAINSENEDHIILSYSNYGVISVYQTLDGAKTWQNIEGNLPDMPVRSLLIDNQNHQTVYLATELGVWYSEILNGENTEWVQLTEGMPNVRVDMLSQRASDGLIAAATHGRGLFTSEPILDSIEETEMTYALIHDYSTIELQETILNGSVCEGNGQQISLTFSLDVIPSEEVIFDIKLVYAGADERDILLEQDRVIFKAREKYTTVNLMVFDDYIVEGHEYAQLNISSINENTFVKSTGSILINIVDNDKTPTANSGAIASYQLGAEENYTYEFPFKGYYEDQRSQFVIRAEELLEMGLNAGPINGLEMMIETKNSDIEFSNFSISMGHTTFDGGISNGDTFINGLQEVFSSDYNTNVGSNAFNFHQAFVWDGKSNLIIQMCFNNSDWSYNDQIVCTQTDYYSSFYQFADSNVGCQLNNIRSSSNLRPVFKFNVGAVASAIATSKGLYTSEVASNETLIIVDESEKIVARLTANAGDLGCVEMGISGSGTDIQCNQSVCFSEKQFYINTEINNTYQIELFFNENEWIGTNDVHIITSEDFDEDHIEFDILEDVIVKDFGSNDKSVVFEYQGERQFALLENRYETHDQQQVTSRAIKNAELSYYPNPFEYQINCKITTDLIGVAVKIEMYSLDGQLVKTWDKILETDMRLEFHKALPSGTYIIKTMAKESSFEMQQKLIKS